METFPALAPSYTSEVEESARAIVSSMGDGYEQRSLGGIHAARLKLRVTYSRRRSVTVATILAFLRARGGVQAFLWTPPPPFDQLRQWVIRPPWNHTWDAFDAETVTFLIEEDFNAPLP